MSGSTLIVVAYILYVVAAIGLAALRPPRQAALIAYCGGWLLLPVAVYAPKTLTLEGFTLDVIGTALPSTLLLTKSLVIPLGVLAGLVWRHAALFRMLRPVPADAAMAAFCLSPLLAAFAGFSGIGPALVQAAYLAGIWGGSWLIGRLLLGDRDGRHALVEAMTWSGVALLPVAIIEGLDGPRLYNLLYGGHPFYADGAERYVGARPLALFEHGNQYGIWIAMAALAAWSLALRRETRSGGSIAVAVLLGAAALASQSVGAILLYLIGAVWLLMSNRIRRSVLVAGALLLAVGAAAYVPGRAPLEHLAYHSGPGQAAMAVLKTTGRNSLSWRVHRDLESLATIRHAALTGYGRWDWWRPVGSHPWGLTLLLAGQFGIISLLLLAFSLLSGPVRALWGGSDDVLPALVVLCAIDAQLNSFIYFIAIVAAGAVAARPYAHDPRDERGKDTPILSTGSLHAH